MNDEAIIILERKYKFPYIIEYQKKNRGKLPPISCKERISLFMKSEPHPYYYTYSCPENDICLEDLIISLFNFVRPNTVLYKLKFNCDGISRIAEIDDKIEHFYIYLFKRPSCEAQSETCSRSSTSHSRLDNSKTNESKMNEKIRIDSLSLLNFQKLQCSHGSILRKSTVTDRNSLHRNSGYKSPLKQFSIDVRNDNISFRNLRDSPQIVKRVVVSSKINN